MQMNDKTVQYKIINKDGSIAEDVKFDNYESLADHMMNLADKWYNGLYDPDDTVQVSTFDNMGELIYEDTATFKETMNEESNLEEELSNISQFTTNNGSSGKGFGGDIKTSRRKDK